MSDDSTSADAPFQEYVTMLAADLSPGQTMLVRNMFARDSAFFDTNGIDKRGNVIKAMDTRSAPTSRERSGKIAEQVYVVAEPNRSAVSGDFTRVERDALYRAIALRRDVRAEFSSDPVDDDVLDRILGAAHQAPSVGLSQPWRFVVIREPAMRGAVHDAFARANDEAAAAYDPQTGEKYRALRLAGILDAPINICVTCDDDPARGKGLGRRTMPETARYSTVCAVQNLWLAARVEGIGVGWVSIVDPSELRTLLGIPPEIAIVAYLCVGHVKAFAPVADLERDGWETRLSLAQVVDRERYGAT